MANEKNKSIDDMIEEIIHGLHYSNPDYDSAVLFSEGIEAFYEKEYLDAIEKFAKSKNPQSNIYIARCHASLMDRMGNNVAYKSEALAALSSYKTHIENGMAKKSDYAEILDFFGQLDEEKFKLDLNIEATELCRTAVALFPESIYFNTRLYNYYIDSERYDEAHDISLRVASFGEISDVLNNFGNLLDLKSDNSDKSILDVLDSRIEDPSNKNGSYMAYMIGNYYAELDDENAKDFNRVIALKYLQKALTLQNDEENDNILPIMEILLLEGINESKSKGLKSKYKKQLKQLYEKNPDYEPVCECITDKPKTNQVIESIRQRPNPMKLAMLLSQYIIEQDETVRRLSIVGANHMKRINAMLNHIPEETLPIKKVLLVHGPTGCGKTYSGQKLAHILGVPVLEYNASNLTESGYVGDSIENIFESLVRQAGSVEDAKYGIILLDEFDKLAARATIGSKDVSGSGAQKTLLKIIEGTEVTLFSRTPRETTFNTKYITPILMGSFTGLDCRDSDISTLDRIVYQRMYGDRRIGFDTQNKIAMEGAAKYAQKEDFIAFGILPEIMGRINKISYCDKLNKNDLKRILTEPKDSLVGSFTQSFLEDNINLSFTQNALEHIAEIASERQGGGRALAEVMELIMEDFEFALPGTDEENLRITKSIVKDKAKKYKIIK